jgi:hypothetical protein
MLALWIVWAVMTVGVLGLALYRKITSWYQEDDYVHLAAGEERAIPHQIEVTHRLDKIDSWGEKLTVVVLIYGLALFAGMLYSAWKASL